MGTCPQVPIKNIRININLKGKKNEKANGNFIYTGDGCSVQG
jgi:hypothetical protein